MKSLINVLIPVEPARSLFFAVLYSFIATTTNTIRQAGFGWGALVLILDIAKGLLPTYLARVLGRHHSSTNTTSRKYSSSDCQTDRTICPSLGRLQLDEFIRQVQPDGTITALNEGK